MSRIAIAGLQLALPGSGDNIAAIGARLDALMTTYPWVEMVVGSELAAFGPSPAHAQPLPGPAEEAFRAMAKRHKIWFVPGSIFESSGGKIYNTASVIDPDGQVIGRYRKQFPFYPYEAGVEGGDRPFMFDIPGVGRFGVLICYDIWFPETARTLACEGCDVILHPAMTTTIDREIEMAITRAAAAVNQIFIIDVNGAGGVGNGRSMIIGPAGELRHVATAAEELIPLEIDLEEARRSRQLGMMHLGQTLKSFRERKVEFPIYGPGATRESEYLASLGPLQKPGRKKRG